MTARRSPEVLAVFAHPDDETLALGGLLALLAERGVPTHLLTATRGEGGWKGTPRPAPREIARVRERELHEAAAVLGIRSVRTLGLADGRVAESEPGAMIRAVALHVRDLRPSAVVTFGLDGLTGHPDHIAVSERVTAALIEAAGAPDLPLRPHRVHSLWHVGITGAQRDAYEALIGPVAWGRVDPPRRPAPWAPWMPTLSLDATSVVDTVRRAVACHCSQLRDPEGLLGAPRAKWVAAFGTVSLVRAMARTAAADPIADPADRPDPAGRDGHADPAVTLGR